MAADSADAGSTALGHFRVLDFTGPLGAYCTKLLADLGADVIKIEPPEGDSSRGYAPFAEDSPHPEKSLYFLNFNSNKRGIVLDLEKASGRETFRRLVRTADAVVEGFPPGYLRKLGLDYEGLKAVNPSIVLTSITPFGQTGPYKDYKGPDIVGMAMGGLMYFQGDPELPPFSGPSDLAYHMAGIHAAWATLLALYERIGSGQGQHVDVSMQETVAHQFAIFVRYSSVEDIFRRMGSRSGISPAGYFPAKDGYVSLYPYMMSHWKSLAQWMQHPIISDPLWESREMRTENADLVDSYIAEFTGQFSKMEFEAEAQKRHIPAVALYTTADFVKDPHIQSRDYFVELEHPVIGRHQYPGAPYRLGGSPCKVARPAPLLGQHTQEVLQELDSHSEPLHQAPAAGVSLKNLRVLDFTRVWAGPYGTRFLAEFGAEVIKVESGKFLDNRGMDPGLSETARRQRNATFADANRNKLSITIDLHHPEGQALIKELVRHCDVVVDNFNPRVMERWGLDYDVLRQVKPDIIMVSMPGLGKEGPHTDYVTYGGNLNAYTGLAYLWGHSGSHIGSHFKLAYPDFVAAGKLALAVMAALHFRHKTGKGQYIQLAQVEATAAVLGVPLLDYFINGRVWEAQGNYSPNAAPHNCYRCRGDDHWCAIVCQDEEEWRQLKKVMGDLPWAEDPQFSTREGRIQHREEMDRRIEEWTVNYTPHQLMRMLQSAGIPAGAVQSGEDLFYDYHLRARGYVVELDEPEVGPLEQPGPTVKLSGTPAVPRPAPALGRHNDYVFRELMGLPEKEIERLVKAEVIY